MDTEREAGLANREEREYFLPAEVLTIIFGSLDPRTLVLRCRLVCTFWKDTIESSDIWKTQIRRHAVSNSVVGQSVLRTAHNVYPWYVCYALCKNIFGINIFTNNLPEGRQRYLAVSQFHSSGGCMFTSPIGTFVDGFNPLPQELVAEGVSTCLLATVGECSLNHTVDLYERGFRRKIMEMQPPIHVSEWFAVRNNSVALYHIDVQLFNADWAVDEDHGRFMYRTRTGRSEWQNMSHTFTGYRPDVRYIVFHHGVDICFPPMYRRYRELETQNPGSKIAGSKVIVGLPILTEASTSEQDDSGHQ